MGAKRTVAICVIAGALALMFDSANATPPTKLPKQSGWSGYLLIGAVYTDFASNMASGSKLGDVSRQTISSLTESPDSDSSVFPAVNLELAYTWANTRTQVYAGNSLIDLLTLDLTTQLGVRQEIGRNGTGYAAFVFSGIPSEVYSDPYVVNTPREVTDRKSRGFRLGWSEIMGSKLNVEYTQRKVELDNERSGTLGGLGLTPEEQRLLNREGDQYEALVSYNFKFNKHYLLPQFTYKKLDADGRAMANDGVEVQLSHGYIGERFSTVINVLAGWFDFDATNPIYGTTRKDDTLGIAFTIIDKKLIPSNRWGVTATVGYYEIDSNIDFYDSEATLVQAGVIYRF